MQSVPQYTCDRCGIPSVYIKCEARNGQVSVTWDLCWWCFEEVRAGMLNAKNRFRKLPEGPS